MDQTFDAGFGGDVRAISGEERDDASSLRDVLRCLGEHQESPAQIGGNHSIEGLDVALPNRGHWHDARVVNHGIDAAEVTQSLRKEPLDISLIGDIGLNRDRLRAGRLDLSNGFLGLGLTARVIDNYGKAVVRQTGCDGAADAAGRSGYDGCFWQEFLLLRNYWSRAGNQKQITGTGLLAAGGLSHLG